ncbi:type IV secretory system conjugative DNA transfer family protein [Ruegeria sp.]|uniref:type IV secretory system conjugative DNA transfer family protein n=1 Tax=Ruegeria sp. TaxID=1879320 RepID=UPI003B005285
MQMISLWTITVLNRVPGWLRGGLTVFAGNVTRVPVVIPMLVLLAIGIGFQQNAGLYKRGILPGDWYEATVITVLLLPPLIGHVTAWMTGYRSAFWWLLWVAPVLIYWGRPWQNDPGWALYWHEHLRAGDILINIFRKQATLGNFIRLGGMLTMAMVTFMVLARPWLRFTAWLREMGRDTGEGSGSAGGGKAEGLPQATWASAADIRDRFTHKGGIVLGEHTDPLEDTPGFEPGKPRTWKRQGKGRLITMNPEQGNGHVIVLAASAGYKTAGIVIPNILHYNKPIVVIDPKGDLYARTRHAREAMGFKPRVIDAGCGFDPFRMIAPLAPQAPSVYLTMARTLMPLNERASDISEYFHEMSTTLFAALMGHFIARGSRNVAQDISKFINREREAVINEAREIAKRHNFPFIADEMEGLAALDERTFPGVVKGISNKLAFTRFPDIAAYSQSDASADAHLSALDPDTDLYINFPAQAAEDFSSFPRLLIGAIYVASELIEQPDRPRARRLLLIDEARVLGGMSALNTIRDAGRSIGLHLMLIYQSYGQMVKAWGSEAGAAAWMDSCEARVISAVGASRTANDIVTMLGRRTLRTHVQGSSSSNPVMVPMGGSVSTSEQEQIREVSLMSAAALGQLPAHGSIVFTRKSRPILATKAIYFTRKEMNDRVRSPDAVAGELAATRRRKALLDEMRARKQRTLPDPQPGLRRNRRPQESVDPETGEIRPAEAGGSDPAQHMPQGDAGTKADDSDLSNAPVSPAARQAATEGTAGANTERPNPALKYQARIKARLDAARAEIREREKIKGSDTDVDAADQDVKTSEPPTDAQDQGPKADTQQADAQDQPGALLGPPPEDHDNPASGLYRALALEPEVDGLNPQDRKAVQTILSLLAERPRTEDVLARTLLKKMGYETQRDRGEDLRNAEIDGAVDVLKTEDKKRAKPKTKKAGGKAAKNSAPEPAKESPERPDAENDAATDNPPAAKKRRARKKTSGAAADAEKPPDTKPDQPTEADQGETVQSEDSTQSEPAGPVPSQEDHPADTPPETASSDPQRQDDGNNPGTDQPDPEADDTSGTASKQDAQGTENDAVEDARDEEGRVDTHAKADDTETTSDIADAHPEQEKPESESSAEEDKDPPDAQDNRSESDRSKPARSDRRKPKSTTDPISKRRAALNADDIREAIDPHIEDLFRNFCGEPVRRRAQEWRAKDNPSFSMRMSGEKRGRWKDHGTEQSGDIFDLIAIEECGLTKAKDNFPRVLEEAAKLAGFSPSQDTPAKRKAREDRKKERERKAQEEEQRRAEERDMLVSALSEQATDVSGTPAETYLTSRSLLHWPETGLAFLPALNTVLPEPQLKGLHAPDRPSLVIWAQDETGTRTGGQRILLTRTGRKVKLKTAKPCFGTVAGAPARFAARPAAEGAAPSARPKPGPLLVAEGPETALTLRHLTGRESWAVFGVSNWKTAPLPTDRDIILAPDQDAPGSPAGQAFRKAVARHMERGCALRIARAPEPEGSKRDLNDTMRTQGAGAVLAALEAAHPPGPHDLPDPTGPTDKEEDSKDEHPEDRSKPGGAA